LLAQGFILQDELLALGGHLCARQVMFVLLQFQVGALQQDRIEEADEGEAGEQRVNGAEHVAENAAGVAGIKVNQQA
jgi:hypothetical protein